jgi:hypothetical protein
VAGLHNYLNAMEHCNADYSGCLAGCLLRFREYFCTSDLHIRCFSLVYCIQVHYMIEESGFEQAFDTAVGVVEPYIVEWEPAGAEGSGNVVSYLVRSAGYPDLHCGYRDR